MNFKDTDITFLEPFTCMHYYLSSLKELVAIFNNLCVCNHYYIAQSTIQAYAAHIQMCACIHTWCALQMRLMPSVSSISCTTSLPKVYDTPLSFSPQPRMSWKTVIILYT